MKEATGELNMTVITIVAIAAIVAFFYFFIYPGIRDSIRLNQACNDPSTFVDATGQDAADAVTCTAGSKDDMGRTEWKCELSNGRSKSCQDRS